MGRQLYPILISTEPPSYTMRYRDTTLPQKTGEGLVRQVWLTLFPETNPLTAKRFVRSLTGTVLRSRLGELELTAAGSNVMEVHLHAG
jgi:hypothetical protein